MAGIGVPFSPLKDGLRLAAASEPRRSRTPLRAAFSAGTHHPRKTLKAPAVDFTPSEARPDVTLKTVQDGQDVRKTGDFKRCACLHRTAAVPADQHDWMVTHAPSNFCGFGDKMGVYFPAHPVVPGNLMRTDRVAREAVLHFASTVDENGVGMIAQELRGFLWQYVLHNSCLPSSIRRAPEGMRRD